MTTYLNLVSIKNKWSYTYTPHMCCGALYIDDLFYFTVYTRIYPEVIGEFLKQNSLCMHIRTLTVRYKAGSLASKNTATVGPAGGGIDCTPPTDAHSSAPDRPHCRTLQTRAVKWHRVAACSGVCPTYLCYPIIFCADLCFIQITLEAAQW
jgi:hypothetical protein